MSSRFFQKFLMLGLTAALCCGAVGCKKKPVDQTEARKKAFIERQRKSAIKAYADLVKNYPDSEYAAKAQQRLNALQPATPAAK